MTDFNEREIEEHLQEPDILETLRWLTTDRDWQRWVYEVAERAADEIEQLRADNERLTEACRNLLPERPSTLGDLDDGPPVDDFIHPVLSGGLGEIVEMETTFVDLSADEGNPLYGPALDALNAGKLSRPERRPTLRPENTYMDDENIIEQAERQRREILARVNEQEAEIERLRGLIIQMVDAYDFRVDGVISADDYLMGVLDLLSEEARRGSP